LNSVSDKVDLIKLHNEIFVNPDAFSRESVRSSELLQARDISTSPRLRVQHESGVVTKFRNNEITNSFSFVCREKREKDERAEGGAGGIVASSIKHETTISRWVGVLFQTVCSHDNEKWRFSKLAVSKY